MSAHEQSVGATDEWYTPRYVFEAMDARFDLDVSAPRIECPAYDFCADAYTSDSLTRGWFGFVWMNPPFGKRMGLVPWLEKFFAHGNGVALVPNRSGPWWHAYAPRADLTLQVADKIKFLRPDGTTGDRNDAPRCRRSRRSGAPSRRSGGTWLPMATREGRGMTDDACPNCGGERWVCENHPHLAWNEAGCECGAGAPCRICNPSTRDVPPARPPGWKDYEDE